MTRLEAYWRTFARTATEHTLENPSLPILEVNANYSAAPSGWLWLGAASHNPEGYRLEAELCVARVTGLHTPELWVEQVPWSRAGTLGKIWCEHNVALEWLGVVSSELARVLQRQPDVQAYLAFAADTPCGVMLVSDQGFCGCWAGSDDAARALFARGAQDFTDFALSLPATRLESFPELRCFERWRVWRCTKNLVQ